MDSKDVDRILEDGVILRSRQQDAIEALKKISNMKDKSIAYADPSIHFYTTFELNMIEIKIWQKNMQMHKHPCKFTIM